MEETVRSARKAEGLSLRELAHLAQVPPSTLSRIERGMTRPTPAAELRIARALGKAVERLFPTRR